MLKLSKLKTRPRGSYFFIALIALLVLGAIVSAFYTLNITNRRLNDSLMGRTASIGTFVNYQQIQNLNGTKFDLENREYIDLKQHLVAARKQNPDVRFIYFLGKDSSGVFFYADSAPPTDPDYSAPGDRYGEASKQLVDSFEKGNNFIEGPNKDSFGNWISALSPIKDDQGKVVAVLGMDIAAKNYQSELIKAAIIPIGAFATVIMIVLFGMHIRRQEQLSSDFKAELVSVASHDLRSPLTGIEWAVENIAESTKEEDTKELAKVVASTVIELRNTTNTILQLALEEKGVNVPLNFELTTLKPIIDEVATTFALSAESHGIKILVDPSITVDLTVRVDKERFKRAISNLVNNAVKYTKANSNITIFYQLKNSQHVVSVKDEGMGIPLADQKKVLEGFHRAANAAKSGIEGTGLGILLVKQIAEAHGGALTFESTENVGTTFHISLPA